MVSDYVEPRVWLVGRPQVNHAGIDSFLQNDPRPLAQVGSR
jgi:hypothetical protein